MASMDGRLQMQHERGEQQGQQVIILDYGNTKGTSTAAHLQVFLIELENSEACYTPGDVIIGYVVLVAKEHVKLELHSLVVKFHGSAKLNYRVKGADSQQEIVFSNDEFELIIGGHPVELATGREQIFRFEKTLKKDLCTSMVSKSASILYSLRACCTYKTRDGAVKRLHTVRGLTIIEQFNLNHLPSNHFEQAAHHLVKKFGLFSCTGGQIRLNFSIPRSAFVCGENITIEGRVENKTDRRVDKISAVLQQVVVIYGEASQSKDGELSVFDVADIHEDNLALFVDEGTSLRIERNFALPPLPPSTFSLDGSDPQELIAYAAATDLSTDVAAARRRRLSVTASRLSFSSSSVIKGSSSCSAGGKGANHRSRFLKILYQLSVRVKTGGLEVMEINVPIVVGTIPCDSVERRIHRAPGNESGAGRLLPNPPCSDGGNQQQQTVNRSALYIQCTNERPTLLALPNENYLCGKSQLVHVNKYPYFVDLPTSSKQSRKVSMLANVVSGVQGEEQKRYASSSSSKCNDDQVGQLEPSQLQEDASETRNEGGQQSSHHDEVLDHTPDQQHLRQIIDRPCRQSKHSAEISKSGERGSQRSWSGSRGLPAVEILIENECARNQQPQQQQRHGSAQTSGSSSQGSTGACTVIYTSKKVDHQRWESRDRGQNARRRRVEEDSGIGDSY